jgi:hypothetical protein
MFSLSLQGNQILYAWAMDAPDLELPDGVGFRQGSVRSTATMRLNIVFTRFSLQGWGRHSHPVPGASGPLRQRGQHPAHRGRQRGLPPVHRRGTAQGKKALDFLE